MPTPRATSAEAIRKSAQAICDQTSGVERKVVAFDNDDVPQYLEKLRKFEKRSRKAGARIVVK